MEQRLNHYDPDHLLAQLIARLRVKNDAALSRALDLSPPVISKIRHRRLPVTGSVLIRMHEVSQIPIHELRALMGDRRRRFRISDREFRASLKSSSRASLLPTASPFPQGVE